MLLLKANTHIPGGEFMIYININLILLALLGLIVVISAVVGLIRGLNKSVVRLMLMVLAVLLTFAIAGPISKVIGNNINGRG